MSRKTFKTSKEDKKTWLIRRKPLWHDLDLLASEAKEDGIYVRTTNNSDIKRKFTKIILDLEKNK